MTRPATTTPRTGVRNSPPGVRNKKRTPARPTAHVGYRPAGYDLWGRRVRARYHAVTDQDITIGTDTRIAGDALCGSYGPWADIPDGLFPPLVSCEKCRHIAARDHITIIGSDT